jgi:catechol 2,3-dioxygenase-like lactoylglutathione lyase family enzyme
VSHGVQRLLRVGRNTRDIGRAIAFHRDALGFEVIDADAPPPTWMLLPGVDAAPSRCARLALGAQELEFTEFPDAAPYPNGSTPCDPWFQHCAIVVSDMDAAYRRLVAQGTIPITQDGPQQLPPSTGSVTAFKFRDPDGHPLELIAFPEGTGDPCWQKPRSGNPATLGIDHSAISVADTGRSVVFHELLGLEVEARGLNRGIEQQRLDDLAGVEVDVIAMQAAARTPHLELLGYRTPRGRAVASEAVTAVVADRVVWQVEGVDALLEAVTAGGFADAVVASGRIHGATLALLRDPDGHRMVLADAAA